MVPQNRERLQFFADTFDRLAADFDRARDKSEKPEHLDVSIIRTAVLAGRNARGAMQAGIIPQLPDIMAIGGRDRSSGAQDDKAVWFWHMAVVPWLAQQFPDKVNSDASDWDHTPVKRDAKGRMLGRDGKPARGQWVSKEGKALKGVDPRNPPPGAKGTMPRGGKSRTPAASPALLSPRRADEASLSQVAQPYGLRLLPSAGAHRIADQSSGLLDSSYEEDKDG